MLCAGIVPLAVWGCGISLDLDPAPPASTTIGVPALAREDALYEVEAIVMLK